MNLPVILASGVGIGTAAALVAVFILVVMTLIFVTRIKKCPSDQVLVALNRCC